MTKHERIQAAIARKPVDRVPYALWRHFALVDRSPVDLVQATLGFHHRYGSDFLKVTPAGGYAVLDWGCVESDRVEPDGHRPCATHAVKAPGDWQKIRPLDIGSGAYGRELDTLGRVLADARADAPLVPTLFSPLSLARKLSGERLNRDLLEHPDAVVQALEAIADTLIRFAAACLGEGAAGIFFSIQAASRRLHSEEEYATYGEPYDRRILESVLGRSILTILHAHGEALMFDRLATLPAHAVNWDDRAAGPSLREGKTKVTGAVIGGLNQWKTLRDGTPDAARAEVHDALAQTGGLGLIVGPGCVLPAGTPDENVAAVVTALGGKVTPILR